MKLRFQLVEVRHALVCGCFDSHLTGMNVLYNVLSAAILLPLGVKGNAVMTFPKFDTGLQDGRVRKSVSLTS